MNPIDVRRQLPPVSRFAIWHSETGLITSPFCRTLPLEIVQNSESHDPADFLKPRHLHDGNVYLVCYPRPSIYRSTLFSFLLSSNAEIPGVIKEMPGNPPEFVMEESVRTAWSRLERGLLTVAQVLISRHPKTQLLPTLTPPRLPSEYGYESAH